MSEATVITPVSFRVRLTQEDTVFFVDSDLDLSGREWPVASITFQPCPDCDGKLEVVDLVSCPHVWKPWSLNKRRCELCGREQVGRVVFD